MYQLDEAHHFEDIRLPLIISDFDKKVSNTVENESHVIIERIRKVICETTQ